MKLVLEEGSRYIFFF